MNKKFTKLIAALALLVFMMPSLAGWGQDTWNHSFSSGQIKTTAGDITLSGKTWTQTAATYIGWDGSTGKGIQIGSSGNPTQSFSLLTADFSTYTISSISVNSSIASSGTAKLNIKVGNTTYLENQALTTTATDYSCQPNVSGNIEISWTNTAKAFYVKSITVVYTTGSGTTTYTVTYDGNGADQGTVPTDNNEYEEGDEVTVLGPGTMAKTGHTFEWWEDAEGIPYEEDDTFEIYENTTLTAQWSVNTYDYTLNVTGDDEEAEAELEVDGSTVATGAKIAYNKEVTVVVVTNDGYRYSIAVEDADHNTISVENDKFTMPASNVTVTVTTTLIPTYTISFNAGTGTAVSPISGLDGSIITLPTTTPSQACASRGWTFAGWAASSVNETTTAPTLLSGEYTITGNATLYAVYQMTEGDGGSFEYVFSEQGFQNAQTVYSATMDATSGIGWAATKGGNNEPKYYDTGTGLRVYNGGTFKVTTNNNTITVVSLTFADGYTFTSNASNPTTWSGSQSTDITWNVSQTCRLQKVNVTYGSSTTTYNSNPECLEKVATPTFTVTGTAIEGEENTYNGAISVAINCTTEDASILYKTTENGEWQTYSNAIPVSTTTTIWAKATKNGMDESEIATATYTIQYTLTVDIDDDLVEYFLFDYTNGTWVDIELDDEGQALVSSGADVRISGGEVYDDCYEVESFNVTDGNSPIAVNYISESMEYSFIMPASNATLTATLNEIANHYTLTVEGLDYVNFELLVGSMSSITTLDANHQASICEHSMVEIDNLTVGYGYVLESVTLTTPGNEPVELTKNAESGLYNFEMPSSNATLAFITGNASYFEAFTGELTEGDYLIVYNGKAMKNSVTSNRLDYIEVTATNDIICADNSIIWHIAPSGDYWTIYSADAEAYAAGNGTNNQAQMLADGTDNKALWAVSGNEVFEFVNKYNSDNYKNANLRNNGTYGFACYNPNNIGGALSLYKKVTPQNYTTMEIQPNQWYFIASPTGTSPTNVEALSDLYYYDEQDHYWRNQKVFANAEGFVNFDLGKGYLAANAGVSVTESVTLTFTGVAITANSYSVDLEYNANTSGNETNTLAGWNLVGNPFPSSATINKDFYVISGKNVMANTGSTVIAPCTGVMVQAEGENESVTFTKVTEGQTPQPNQLQMTVAQNATNRGTAETIDNAIVSFNEGSQLEKFIFNADLSKLYIPQNDKEYAIVSAEAQGEMPVNFRAAENGTYTLSIDAENVEMNYLHLIDNMTGADVDLLQTPNYTFEATTRDYESRFRLVFAANEDGVSTGSTAFAFFSNGNWIINNDGEATLQVIDLTGRILSSESVNGSVSTTLNATPGVYMLRLINGENVKVQKIVVR